MSMIEECETCDREMQDGDDIVIVQEGSFNEGDSVESIYCPSCYTMRAAAPELLEALKEALPTIYCPGDINHQVITNVKAAIAKAENA